MISTAEYHEYIETGCLPKWLACRLTATDTREDEESLLASVPPERECDQ